MLYTISKKVAMSMVKDDETKVLGNLELCGVQDAECEATLHSIHDIFATNETKAVLLFDAENENASNSKNRHVFLHNIKHICTTKATFVCNCYNVPARLFILGGKEVQILSKTTQDKTILNDKLEYESKTAEMFDNINIKITSSRQRHLIDTIESELYGKECIKEIANKKKTLWSQF